MAKPIMPKAAIITCAVGANEARQRLALKGAANHNFQFQR
jgi:hypothetical protein